MGRIKVQKGCLVAFPRFLFREYHQGHVSAEVLTSILSECERLTSSEWSKFYPLSAQQLFDINEAQAREGKPAISPATFLDMNSIHLIDDPFKVWEERYKVYVPMHKALRDNHNHYPITMDQFLSCASFGARRFLKMNMDKDTYADLLYQHLDLHLKRMTSTMGPSYSIPFGGVVPFGCEGRPGGIQGVVPFGCEGRPGVVSRALFPSDGYGRTSFNRLRGGLDAWSNEGLDLVLQVLVIFSVVAMISMILEALVLAPPLWRGLH
ncbi:hypothetical protein Taro_035984 [Colocasia esculenta]|uniref:Uncharacterized protein n=1 Tax=Colocasia esculenta TaxID=4460 RepID=A0A843W1V6_COLES|nr:hypothetical protein [Colocasia esculenta]